MTCAFRIEWLDKIFKGINSVVDLGAAPGSWSQYAATKIKSEKILSIDLLKFEKIKNSHQIIGDFTDEDHKIEIKKTIKFPQFCHPYHVLDKMLGYPSFVWI